MSLVAEVCERKRDELGAGKEEQPERWKLPNLGNGAPRQICRPYVRDHPEAVIARLKCSLGRLHTPEPDDGTTIVNDIERDRKNDRNAKNGSGHAYPP